MHSSDVKDLSYQAMEPTFNRIRLARDPHFNIYIMSKPLPGNLNFNVSDYEYDEASYYDGIPFMSPYAVALASRELYRIVDRMETMTLNDIEMKWINRMNEFVRSMLAGSSY